MPDDVEAIVKGLTKAQRETILQSRTWSGDICLSPTLISLNKVGLLQHVTNLNRTLVGAHPTSLGLRVRKALQESEHG